MSQKAFIKLEKKLACDLRPGDLFAMDMEDTTRFINEMNGGDPSMAVFLRTNIAADEFEDMDVTVYKVHVTVIDPEEGLPPRINPHAPPGTNNAKG
jgi:hypothetical protein